MAQQTAQQTPAAQESSLAQGLQADDQHATFIWRAAIGLGAGAGLIVSLLVVLVAWLVGWFGWLVAILVPLVLIATGVVAGALLGRKVISKGETWLRQACGLSAAQGSTPQGSTPQSSTPQSSTPQNQPRLHNQLQSTCLSTGVDLEEVLILDSPQINLLVIGANPFSATLLVTTGLTESLDRIETEAMLALALGQVHSTRSASLTVILSTVGLPFVMLEASGSAFARRVAKAACRVTRQRFEQALAEFDDIQADLAAVEITRYPPGLISALQRAIETGTNPYAGTSLAETPQSSPQSPQSSPQSPQSVLWMLPPTSAGTDSASAGETGSASSGETGSERTSLQQRIQVLREL